jgi:hypothetical protein
MYKPSNASIHTPCKLPALPCAFACLQSGRHYCACSCCCCCSCACRNCSRFIANRALSLITPLCRFCTARSAGLSARMANPPSRIPDNRPGKGGQTLLGGHTACIDGACRATPGRSTEQRSWLHAHLSLLNLRHVHHINPSKREPGHPGQEGHRLGRHHLYWSTDKGETAMRCRTLSPLCSKKNKLKKSRQRRARTVTPKVVWR